MRGGNAVLTPATPAPAPNIGLSADLGVSPHFAGSDGPESSFKVAAGKGAELLRQIPGFSWFSWPRLNSAAQAANLRG